MLDLYAPALGGVLRLVISIGLLGCYPCTHFVFYIYLVPSLMLIINFYSRVFISLQFHKRHSHLAITMPMRAYTQRSFLSEFIHN